MSALDVRQLDVSQLTYKAREGGTTLGFFSHKWDANAHNWKQMWIPRESRV